MRLDGEACVVKNKHLKELLSGYNFNMNSGSFAGCRYTLNRLDKFKAYITSVGSKQVFRRCPENVDVKGMSVSHNGMIYFTVEDSALIYCGSIDDIEYTDTGSIVFVRGE